MEIRGQNKSFWFSGWREIIDNSLVIIISFAYCDQNIFSLFIFIELLKDYQSFIKCLHICSYKQFNYINAFMIDVIYSLTTVNVNTTKL